jgi:hypothetical protein
MKPFDLKKGVLTHAVLLLNIALVIGLLIAITGRDFPKVGDDYRIHIPRMLDTHLHHLINGLRIQWYTPSFGGGLPAYPNPLYIQYSLPQALLFVINPWTALMTSMVIYALIGAFSFYAFLKSVLDLSWAASALGATFLLANGFYLEHFIAGHVGYQQFPLLGLILLAAFSKKIDATKSAIVIGIAFALMVNQAGFYLIIIFALSMAVCLPMLYLMRPAIFQDLKFARALSGGVVFGVLLSLSKITAVISFMQYFPRELSDNYGLTLLQGLKGLVTQLAGFMTIAPVFMAQGKNVNELTKLLQTYTGSRYEIWETDISISPAALLLLLFSAVAVFRHGIPKFKKVNAGTAIAVICLALGSWLAVEFSLAKGPLYSLLSKLPILRSTHVNVRFASAFILPASILASRGFDNLFFRQNSQVIVPFILLSSVTIAAFIPYFSLGPLAHLRYFDLKLPLQNYEQIQQGQRFPIRGIADIKDVEVFKRHSSNLYQLYDAIFGYELEDFQPKVQTGSVFKEEDGYYNMTNPASYVFPTENGLQVYERFRVDQKAELELFINRRQPDFKISTLQTVSNIINVIAVVLLVFYIFFNVIKRRMINSIFTKHVRR